MRLTSRECHEIKPGAWISFNCSSKLGRERVVGANHADSWIFSSLTEFRRLLMLKDFILTILFSYSNNLVTQLGDILAEMLVNYLRISCSI